MIPFKYTTLNIHTSTFTHVCLSTQAAMLGRLDALMTLAPGLGGAAGGAGNGLAAMNPGQFDDAEDEEAGEGGANGHGEDELPQ